MASVDEALALAGSEAITIAVVDIGLRDEAVYPVVDLLQSRSVPVMFTTGYDATAIPSEYRHLRRHEKPYCYRTLLESLIAHAPDAGRSV